MVTEAAAEAAAPKAQDEAGTPPSDRPFRPDIQGLRALAVCLVVLFHAGASGISGGFVGVDVFFVISGFVITGLLLRESEATGHTSLVAFYGRRIRRILPAASLVIVVTVALAAIFLGLLERNQTAIAGIWASLFLANFHFIVSGTNYLASQQLPSPLQNFWSLAVEEQFYAVYPVTFLALSAWTSRKTFRTRLIVFLGIVIVASFAYSVTITSSDPSEAFFSPLTRAWELALGAMIATAAVYLSRIPTAIAGAMTWIGLGGIITASVVFTSATPYPGWAVALPVIGTGLVIAGGTARPSWGAERALGIRPVQYIGLISYSLYLWHWPILVIAAEHEGAGSLPFVQNIPWVILSVVLAVATYRLLENPIRHSRFFSARLPLTLALGAVLVVSSLGFSAIVAVLNPLTSAAQLEQAASGTRCLVPSMHLVTNLRDTYLNGPHQTLPTPGTKPVRIDVIGDSTACTILPGLMAVAPSFGAQVGNGAVDGCGIVSGRIAPIYVNGVDVERLTGSCQAEALSAETASINAQDPNVIVWMSSWERQSIVSTGTGGNRILLSGTPQWRKEMFSRIDARITSLTSTGAKVVFVLSPPRAYPGSTQQSMADAAKTARLNSLLREVATRHSGRVGVVDLSPRVCPTGPPCPGTIAGINVRVDRDHYGDAGSLFAGSWLFPRILQTASGANPAAGAATTTIP